LQPCFSSLETAFGGGYCSAQQRLSDRARSGAIGQSAGSKMKYLLDSFYKRGPVYALQLQLQG
jgi:hypothetical protein